MNSFKQGEHICALYQTAEEQVQVAADYLADGLRNGERVFYVAGSDADLERFRRALNLRGIDVSAAIETGALMQATHQQAHLEGGRFDSERMLGMLNAAMDAALDDGFTGLRTCGDMSWLLDGPPGAAQVVEYEALLNRFFAGVRGAGMCQYDLQRLTPVLIDHGLATHQMMLIDGRLLTNPFYQEPEVAVSRSPEPAAARAKVEMLRSRT